MNPRVLPVLALVFLLPSLAAAQQAPVLTGVITTRDDGLSLPGATVSIEALSLSATTDNDGRYTLTLPPEAVGQSYEVRVSAAGLVPRTWTLRPEAGTLTQDFALSLTFQEEITVGSRAVGVEAEKATPVDILTSRQIETAGFTETMQVVQALAPSFNFPRTTIADGSASVRPATLRGLGPDQILVLLNGKRRHNTALVHVNGTVGRGSTGVDLNAIPISAIERVEILRDGAAAQYGSDAIAGVMNIVLKSGKQPLTLSAKAGAAITDQGVGDNVTDGELFDGSASMGWNVGSGWLSAALEFRDRNRTNRAAPDLRDQIRAGDRLDNPVAQPNHWVGDPEARDVIGFLNAQFPIGGSGSSFVYAFGGWSRRDALAPGFFRRALEAGTQPAIYPLGYLPKIETDTGDAAGTLGVRGVRSDWYWDLSATYGRNTMGFNIVDTLNVSLGPTIPPNALEFYAGQLAASQFTANADLSRQLELGLSGPTNLAIGVEFRREGYQIVAGEEGSYIDGGFRDQFGNPATPGAQVFAGWRPSNERDESRSNVAAYIDAEGDLVPRLRLGMAGRVENYSDFGSTADGKITARFKVHDRAVLRGAASTGFRAPSLPQSHFSATSTNFLNLGQGLVPVEVATFPVGSEPARALGATDLQPEESTHLSAGLVLTPRQNFDLTVDYYRIDIDDRIVLSGNFTDARVRTLLAPFGTFGSARFFTNAIDTETTGWDLTAAYRMNMDGAGTLGLFAGYNRNETTVVSQAPAPPELVGLESVLFDREQTRRMECGQPEDNLRLSADWLRGRFNGVVRGSRYGEYCDPRNGATVNGVFVPTALDQDFSAQWIADLELSFRMRQLTLGAGAQNIFDTYPEILRPENARAPVNPAGGFLAPGAIRYGTATPFGINGRFLYGRITYRF
jgi:iron complex outermembrane receptor protein